MSAPSFTAAGGALAHGAMMNHDLDLFRVQGGTPTQGAASVRPPAPVTFSGSHLRGYDEIDEHRQSQSVVVLLRTD